MDKTTTPRLILHIGAGKCGSSALQQALALSDITRQSGGRVAYAVISAKHGVLHGDKLRKIASRSLRGLLSSVNPKTMAGLGPAFMERIATGIEAPLAAADCVILSCEGWLQHAGRLSQLGFFDALGARFSAFVAVRPQVGWMNSGWWQWGAWTGQDPERWIAGQIPRVQWHRAISDWQALAGCAGVDAIVLPQDIRQAFADLYGFRFETAEEAGAINAGLPAEVLRLYQRQRVLRPGPDDSAMDFVLARHGLGTAATPWVLEPDQIAAIIEGCRADNDRLLQALPPAQAERMAAERAWWDPAAFAGRQVEPAGPTPPDPAQLDRLCSRMAQVILDLDRQLLRLESIAQYGTIHGGKPSPPVARRAGLRGGGG